MNKIWCHYITNTKYIVTYMWPIDATSYHYLPTPSSQNTSNIGNHTKSLHTNVCHHRTQVSSYVFPLKHITSCTTTIITKYRTTRFVVHVKLTLLLHSSNILNVITTFTIQCWIQCYSPSSKNCTRHYCLRHQIMKLFIPI